MYVAQQKTCQTAGLEWARGDGEWILRGKGQAILTVPRQADCEDVFEPIGAGAFRWTRRTEVPIREMKMTVRSAEPPRYWLVPAVNYNGNGWGSGAQYAGFESEGEPWTYAWHRIAIPACTYAESEHWAVSLFGEEEGGMSGSICLEDGRACQSLLWPEQEGPKVLFKRCWMEQYQGSMQPRSEFTAILFVTPAGAVREDVHALLDFAWDYFSRPVTMRYPPEEVTRLDTLFFRTLWQRLYDGVTGFKSGKHWVEAQNDFVKSDGSFEMGWVGQNIALSCLLLEQYLKTGDADLKEKGLSVLDSWIRYAQVGNGLMLVHLKCDPANVDSIVNGDIPSNLDACNLGVGATYFFRAHELAARCGEDRPQYLQAARGLCDFALRAQRPSGEFAKSWFLDGSVDSPHGSVGCFFTVALFAAHRATGEEKYLNAALRSFDFYYGEFERTGYTTAGALDSFCIDKESAAPLLRSALLAFHATGDRKYVDAAEQVAYYLATWQWHYSVRYPDGSMLHEIGYDTYGSTSVSAAHNALDHYGLYWVPEYLELARLTGKDMWRSRARALWYNGTELLSDGTLVIRGRVRPAGSQEESIRHTRWGRPDKKYFTTSEWLTSWQGTYRELALDALENWDDLR